VLSNKDKSQISGWSAPSNKFVNLTLGASGTGYVMPANGWLYFRVNAVGNKVSQIRIQRGASTIEDITFMNIVNLKESGAPALTITAPVKKGETQYVYYDNADTGSYVLRVYYAEGEV
jgi:hypothetical protein